MFSSCYLWWYLRQTLLGHPLWVLLFMAIPCAARYRMPWTVRKSLYRNTKGLWVGIVGSLWRFWFYSTIFYYLQIFLLYLEWTLLFPLLCYWYFCLLFPFAHFFCTWCCFFSADMEDFLKSSLQILVYPFFCILFSVSQIDCQLGLQLCEAFLGGW